MSIPSKEEIINMEKLLVINDISKALKVADKKLLMSLKSYLYDEYVKSDRDNNFLKAAFDRVSAIMYLMDVYNQTEEYFK